jgi:hypothetical protein
MADRPTKIASRPERARGDGQDGGRALATGIVPHEWPSGKWNPRARPPSKRHRWRALLFRLILIAKQEDIPSWPPSASARTLAERG